MEETKIIKLNGDNYETWLFQISIILKSQAKYEVASGKSIKPGNVSDEQTKWLKDDIEAQRLIVTSVSEHILSMLTTCESAHQMLLKLETLFAYKSEASLFNYQQEFFNLKYDCSLSVAENYTVVERLTSKLRCLGEPIQETMIMSKILTMLPPDFAHFHSAWDSVSKDQKTLNNLLARLLLEEQRISFPLKTEQNVALPSNVCFKCKGRGHLQNDCFRYQNGPPVCYNCNKPGHLMRYCNEKHYDESKIALMGNVGTDDIDDEYRWFLDSGASQHMSHIKEWFVNFNIFHNPKYVKIGDGSSVEATGAGDIELETYDGERWLPAILRNVLYVPKLTFNLLSLGSSLDKGYKFVSDKRMCKIIRNREIIAMGVRSGKLYEMFLKSNVLKENDMEISRDVIFKEKTDDEFTNFEREETRQVDSTSNEDLEERIENMSDMNLAEQVRRNENEKEEASGRNEDLEERKENYENMSEMKISEQLRRIENEEEGASGRNEDLEERRNDDDNKSEMKMAEQTRNENEKEVNRNEFEVKKDYKFRDRLILRKPGRFDDFELMTMIGETEEMTLEEAPRDEGWRKVIDEEMSSIITNKTWNSVRPPKNKKPLSCKRVFRVKQTENREKNLEVYTNGDFVDDLGSRRSRSRCVRMINGGAKYWSSRRQATVALNTVCGGVCDRVSGCKEVMR